MPNGKARPGAKRTKRSHKRVEKLAVSGLSSIRSGLPDRFRVTMPYASICSIAPGAGTVANYSYRGNSLFDPDFTGTGTTAFTYTQLSALYNRYRVISARIHVSFVNTSAGVLTHLLQASIANAPPTAVNMFGARHVARNTTSPGRPSWEHKAQVYTHAVYGVPKAQVLSEDDFAGLVGGSPNNPWYFHLTSYNPTATAATSTAEVRIEYEVVWSMPLNVAP